MEHLSFQVKKIAERVYQAEQKRQRLAEQLREPASAWKRAVTPSPLTQLTVAAVDGGIVKKSLHGMDCLLVRAVGVCFEYRQGKVAGVRYFPSRQPMPRAEMQESVSEIEWAHFAALQRLHEEVGTAFRTVQTFHPQMLLMDGMIMPHYLDRPQKSSPLYPLYETLLETYRALLAQCNADGTIIAGVVEDSRNTVFCEQLLGNVPSEMVAVLRSSYDSQVLSYLLEKGDMTTPIATVRQEGLPAMQSFYLKTAEHDRPLKIDCLVESNPETIASLLLALSGYHSRYGMPIPLIEADSLAKLSEQDMETFSLQLQSLTRSLGGMFLRREQRPF